MTIWKERDIFKISSISPFQIKYTAHNKDPWDLKRLLKSVNASLRAKQFYNKNQAKLKMKSVFIKMEGKTTVLFLKLKNGSMLKKKKKSSFVLEFLLGQMGWKLVCIFYIYHHHK